jgi:hypothetical protein
MSVDQMSPPLAFGENIEIPSNLYVFGVNVFMMMACMFHLKAAAAGALFGSCKPMCQMEASVCIYQIWKRI